MFLFGEILSRIQGLLPAQPALSAKGL